MTVETRDEGGVGRRIYLQYAKAAGWRNSLLVIVAFAVYPAIQAGTTGWLVAWSEDRLGLSQPTYLAIYGSVSLGAILLMLGRQILRSYVSVQASRKLHERMLDAVLKTRISFFETTPQGRVVNRFSNDMMTIDEQLAQSLGEACQCFFNLLVTFAAISLSSPWFVALVPLLMLIYGKIQAWFIVSSRELKRIDNVTKSPIYAHFGETLSGAVTIRAYGEGARFAKKSMTQLDRNVQASYLMNCGINRWLMLNTQGMIGPLTTGITAVLAAATGQASPGLAAMAIKYSMQVSWSLMWLVRAFTDTETQCVSVERCIEYASLEPEEPASTTASCAPPPAGWPARGRIEWRDVHLRYRSNLAPALRGINVVIEAGSKVGVCGRTVSVNEYRN